MRSSGRALYEAERESAGTTTTGLRNSADPGFAGRGNVLVVDATDCIRCVPLCRRASSGARSTTLPVFPGVRKPAGAVSRNGRRSRKGCVLLAADIERTSTVRQVEPKAQFQNVGIHWPRATHVVPWLVFTEVVAIQGAVAALD